MTDDVTEIRRCRRCDTTKADEWTEYRGHWYCVRCMMEMEIVADRALERGGAGNVAYYRQGLEDALGVPVREIVEGGRWPKDITNDSGYLRRDSHPSRCHEVHGWTVPLRQHLQFVDEGHVRLEVAALACRHCDRVVCIMLVHRVDCGCGACPPEKPAFVIEEDGTKRVDPNPEKDVITREEFTKQIEGIFYGSTAPKEEE